jgi:alkylhydroperoxidase family enzyme
LPPAFGLFYSKINKLDKKLTLPPQTVLLIREQVARINVCLFCMDIARSAAIKATMNEAKFDALEQYRTSTLFTDAERAALDYVTELTKDKKVDPDTFARRENAVIRSRACLWLSALIGRAGVGCSEWKWPTGRVRRAGKTFFSDSRDEDCGG